MNRFAGRRSREVFSDHADRVVGVGRQTLDQFTKFFVFTASGGQRERFKTTHTRRAHRVVELVQHCFARRGMRVQDSDKRRFSRFDGTLDSNPQFRSLGRSGKRGDGGEAHATQQRSHNRRRHGRTRGRFRAHHSLGPGAGRPAPRGDRAPAWMRIARLALWISPYLLGLVTQQTRLLESQTPGSKERVSAAAGVGGRGARAARRRERRARLPGVVRALHHFGYLEAHALSPHPPHTPRPRSHPESPRCAGNPSGLHRRLNGLAPKAQGGVFGFGEDGRGDQGGWTCRAPRGHCPRTSLRSPALRRRRRRSRPVCPQAARRRRVRRAAPRERG